MIRRQRVVQLAHMRTHTVIANVMAAPAWHDVLYGVYPAGTPRWRAFREMVWSGVTNA